MNDEHDPWFLLSMLLATCDSLKGYMRHEAVEWDERKPSIYYLNRNMEWAREALKAHKE